MAPDDLNVITPQQQALAGQLYAEWLRMRRITTFSVGIFTAGGVAAIWMIYYPNLSAAVALSCLAFLLILFVYLVIMAVQDSRFRKRVLAVPELIPPEPDSQTKAYLDLLEQQYKQEEKHISTVTGLMIIAGILIPGPGIAVWIAAIIYRWKARAKLPLRSVGAAAQVIERTERGSSLRGHLALIPLLLAVPAFFFLMLAESVATGRMTSANMMAKSIYNAAETARVDLADADKPCNFRTGVYYGADAVPADSEFAVLYSYFPDVQKQGNYFALVCDDSGALRYTLWSRKPITDMHQRSGAEQYSTKNVDYFTSRFVGCYPLYSETEGSP